MKSDSGLNRQDVGGCALRKGRAPEKSYAVSSIDHFTKIEALLLKYWSTDIYGFGNDSVWHF